MTSTSQAAATPVEAFGAAKQSTRLREARWVQILEAAAFVFHEKGYSAATLQDIADRVGILKGSIYYYIKTKGDLLENLLFQVHAEGLAMVRESLGGQGDVLDRLDRLVHAYLSFIIDNPEKTTVYIHEVQQLSREARDKIFRDHSLRRLVEAVLVEGQTTGLIHPSLDPRLAAQTMLSSLNSIYQWYQPSADRPAPFLIDHMAVTTLRGLASDEGLRRLRRPDRTASREQRDTPT